MSEQRLSVWTWILHRLTRSCQSMPAQDALVRHGLRREHPPVLGEVWRLCPACGRVLGKRPETAADAAQFGLEGGHE